MDPSMYKSSNDITIASSPFLHRHSNPNVLMSTHHPMSPTLTSNKTHSTHHRYSYSDLPSGSTSALNYMDLFRNWNYHQYLISSVKTDPVSDHSSSNEYHPRTSSFHQYYRRSFDKPFSQSINDEHILGKFHYDTVVQLDTGESKNIQQLTTHDLLASAQQSPRYSSLLARIDHIGTVDQSTGKVELRFYIEEIEKTTSYYVLQEMPFFVQQYSCWSSVSPEHTHRLCGLKCRQLECGDHIIAVTERLKSPPKQQQHTNIKPDYRQQSPTKSLVGRYIDGETSNKRARLSNE